MDHIYSYIYTFYAGFVAWIYDNDVTIGSISPNVGYDAATASDYMYVHLPGDVTLDGTAVSLAAATRTYETWWCTPAKCLWQTQVLIYMCV